MMTSIVALTKDARSKLKGLGGLYQIFLFTKIRSYFFVYT